ncbi:MAG: KilA-N domain-containing protein [Symploca sp. SIO2G7]|nr:KilA-N domain-containing protein [Symploca sp. SIO2G7]
MSVSPEERSQSSLATIREDGYVNLTALAQAHNKRVSHFLELKSTKGASKDLSQQLNLLPDQLIEVNKGGVPEKQGTWVHPKIAEKFKRWIEKLKQTPKTNEEDGVQARLHHSLKGKREVSHPVGFIDLLTPSQIIEIKQASQWMKGVGQLMVYGQDYPFHLKRLHLFGGVSTEKKKLIEQYCARLSIKVTWEN